MRVQSISELFLGHYCQEYIITRVSNLQYPRRNIVYKVTWLPVYCTWACDPDCRDSTRLAVTNLGCFALYLVQHDHLSAVFQVWFLINSLIHFSVAQLLLMTFARDHALSKYVPIEIYKQSTDTFTAFSHVQYQGSHVTLYIVFLHGYWRLDTLVIMFSWQ